MYLPKTKNGRVTHMKLKSANININATTLHVLYVGPPCTCLATCNIAQIVVDLLVIRTSQERCEGRKERDGTDEQGLRSRGLCLVPIATTLHVAKDNISTDFWAPTFGGSYR
ncbi:hypothetical protein ACLOJK_014393 [Asimina triloba]